MAFTPNPNLFNQSVAGGLANGQSLLGMIEKRRERSALQEISAMLPQNSPFEQAGSKLMEIGQVGAGLRTMNIPYQREQQQLQRDFQNQQAQMLQGNRQSQLEMQQRRYDQTQQNSDRAFDYNAEQDAINNEFKQNKFDLESDPTALGQGSFTKPFQAMGADGKRVWVQSDSDGNSKVLEGFSPLNALQKTDTGTEIIMSDRAGNVVSRTPKANQEEARQTAVGKIQGTTQAESAADLPRVMAQTNDMINVIDGILNHPGLSSAIGNVDSRLPDLIAGQEVVDFRTRASQLEGKTFLQAFQSLKGGGQITEAEGSKATAAIARLAQSQSEGSYRAALNELRGIVQNSQLRAANKAQSTANSVDVYEQELAKPASQRTPIIDLMNKYGDQ